MVIWPLGAGVEPNGALARLLASTPHNIPIVVGPELKVSAAEAALAQRQDRSLEVRNGAGQLGRFLTDVAAAHACSDLILISEQAEPPQGWFERLRAAAYRDDLVAAATALPPDSAPGMCGDFGEGAAPAQAQPHSPPSSAQRLVSAPHAAVYPRVLVPGPHLAWIRRSALGLTGPFDASLTDPAALLEDFAARAITHGMWCVLSDDVWAVGRGYRAAESSSEQREAIRRRHPWLEPALEDQTGLGPGPLRRALRASGAARRKPSVTIDARALGPGVGGTQSYVRSLVLALAGSQAIRVRAVVAPNPPEDAVMAFAAAGVEVVSYDQAARGLPLTDVVHRPQQVFTPADLRLLQMLGDRIVISQMDLITYRNPTYHADVEAWRAYRRVTRLALATADRVLFFSDHARRDTLAEDLIEPARGGLAGIGVDASSMEESSRRPSGVPADRELLVAIGADYIHKNRPFALLLADELRRRHSWTGLLILAGSHVPFGSSADEERRILQERPELAAGVIDLGRVSEAEKRWLLDNATAHLCSSCYEGFGLAPLEAAQAGRPCIFAPVTSLAEIIDSEAATIVPWDPAASADAAVHLLHPGQVRDHHLRALGRALQRHTWRSVVEQLIDGYDAALSSPYPGAAPQKWEELTREELIVDLDRAQTDLRGRVAYGMSLIDSDDPLLTRAQQRGLMRVASRRWLRGPLLGPFGLLGADDRPSR